MTVRSFGHTMPVPAFFRPVLGAGSLFRKLSTVAVLTVIASTAGLSKAHAIGDSYGGLLLDTPSITPSLFASSIKADAYVEWHTGLSLSTYRDNLLEDTESEAHIGFPHRLQIDGNSYFVVTALDALNPGNATIKCDMTAKADSSSTLNGSADVSADLSGVLGSNSASVHAMDYNQSAPPPDKKIATITFSADSKDKTFSLQGHFFFLVDGGTRR